MSWCDRAKSEEPWPRLRGVLFLLAKSTAADVDNNAPEQAEDNNKMVVNNSALLGPKMQGLNSLAALILTAK